ncbi:hypothetical protein [Emticicia sp. SJ17W-69]|uniref:hypothetical protein n=1 Tax=Emticicia sp. SJ17W-69 TaxID=3421657 RepID=UPI003EB8EC0C
MKIIYKILIFNLLVQISFGQSVTIDPRNSKIIDNKSSIGGVLVPRMTTTQRNAIQGTVEGLLVYDTDAKTFFYIRNGIWKSINGEITLPFSGAYSNAITSAFSLLNNDNSTTANAGKFEAPYGIGVHGIGGDIGGKFISAAGRGIYAESGGGGFAGEFYGGNGIGVKIDVNGNIYNSLVIPRGKVGIGTLTPSALFQVKGSINDYLWETTAKEAPNTSDITVGLRVNQQYVNSPETAKVMLGTKSNHAFNLFTNDNHASPDMTIFNGKVGIGTETPTHPLSFSNTFGNKISFWKDANSTDHYGVGIEEGLLKFYTSGQDRVGMGYHTGNSFIEKFTFKSGDGRIGIDNTDPIAPLSFSNVSGNKISFLKNEDSNKYFGLGIENSTLRIHTAGEDKIAMGFYTNSNNFWESLTIKTGFETKVGINNDNPIAPLSFNHLEGEKINLSYYSPERQKGITSSYYALEFYSQNPNDEGEIAFGYKNENNFEPTMTLFSQTGQLGIGTDNISDLTGYKLGVNGAIRAKEIVVNSNWADFVFEKDYKLPNLHEVERFIANNQHLPNIPSAKEIQKNGVALGETQTLMMQKIEELTLYIIELNKKIELLENNQKR